MQFHAEAVDLAHRQGLFERQEVIDRIHHLPAWLTELHAPGSVTTSDRDGVHAPYYGKLPS